MELTKRTLDNREDIARLVDVFYAAIRQDEVLGPIFNGMIHDWAAHLEKLTDFWEGNLLFGVKPKFQGDPKTAHQKVDDFTGNILTMEHFGRWINLWIATLDKHFEGETAIRAKMLARKMATFFFIKIVEHRRSVQQ
jgi:hemoglobin